MKRSLLVFAIPVLVLVGCKASRESQLAGTWHMTGKNVVIKADKTWSGGQSPAQAEGTWSFADPKLSLTITKINGLPPAEAKKKIMEQFKGNPMLAAAGGEKKISEMIDKQLAKPQELTLSEDGKTLSATDAASGNSATFTKVDDGTPSK